jgi:glycosyltransferase involved in cell wall biosynthesis
MKLRIHKRPTACFFARVSSPDVLERVEFYAQDAQALRDLGYDVRVVTRTRDLFSTAPADLYFVWWWTRALPVVLYARMLRRPVVVTGTFDYNLFPSRPAFHRTMIRLAARYASANIFVSRLERTEVPLLIPETTNPRYSPHVVDTSVYRPEASGRSPDALLAVAWLNGTNPDRKGLTATIQALPEVAKAHDGVSLTVVGERGSAYPRLSSLAEELRVKDRVHFVGAVSRDEKIRLLQTCALYVQPSKFEGFGVAILEAMACGAAVVTRPAGAVPEVGGDAVHYAAGDGPEDIAHAVSSLLSDPARRTLLGKMATERAFTLFPYERRRSDIRKLIELASAQPQPGSSLSRTTQGAT